jgi:hypothetical protein
MKGKCSKCGKLIEVPKAGAALDHPCGAPILVSLSATASGESHVK